MNYNKRDIWDIDYKQLVKMQKQQSLIIDVRSKQEFQEKHLDGAINIPLVKIKDEIQQKIVNKNTLIILYCQYGARSKKAQNILNKLGYSNVYNLKEGLDGI